MINARRVRDLPVGLVALLDRPCDPGDRHARERDRERESCDPACRARSIGMVPLVRPLVNRNDDGDDRANHG